MFEDSFVNKNSMGKSRKAWTMLASLFIQVAVVCALILIPLIFTEALPQVLARTSLTAPPPPPPPPPPSAPAAQPVRPTRPKPTKPCGALCVPKVIKDIKAMPQDTEEIEKPNVPSNGVPGGTGANTGVITVIGGLPNNTPPPPPPAKTEVEKPKVEVAKPTGPIRIGGNVQQANLIKKVTPLYPPLAKQARVSGTVSFTAIISRDGTIRQLQLVSGHPLLVPAATEAVKQWLYRPTTLNDEPVEVITQIDVNFTLAR